MTKAEKLVSQNSNETHFKKITIHFFQILNPWLAQTPVTGLVKKTPTCVEECLIHYNSLEKKHSISRCKVVSSC